MRIVNLRDYNTYMEEVAGWIYKEFVEPVKTDRDFNDVLSDLKKRKRNDIPMTLIALKNEECVGTVTLFKNDLKTMDVTPWLGSLYVDENNRGKGIAKALMKEVSNIAKNLEYDTLYLRTEQAAKYYEKNGWEYVLKTHDDEIGMETEVFKKRL